MTNPQGRDGEPILTCLRCGQPVTECVGEKYQWSEQEGRATFWHYDMRCGKCAFISRFARLFPVRPARGYVDGLKCPK